MSSLWPSHYTNYAIPALQLLLSFINPFVPVDQSTCSSMGFKITKMAQSSPLTCTVQTCPNLQSFKLSNLKKVKTSNNYIFKMVQWNKHGRRIPLSDNAGSRVVMLQALRFQRAGVQISTGLHCTKMYSWLYVHSLLTYTKFNLHQIFQKMNAAKFRDCLYWWPFKFSYFSVSPWQLILAQKG
jgi:hypothetical protein